MKRLLIFLLAVAVMPWPLTASVHADATLTASPSSVQPTGRLTVQGSGYGPRLQYTLTVNTPTPLTLNVVADVNGNIVGTFIIPGSTPPGAYAVSVYLGNQFIAQATFQVSAVQIYVSPNPVPAGSTVTVSGTGFFPGSSVTVHTTVTTSGGPTQSLDAVTTVTTGGTFTASFTVPGNTVGGNYTIHVLQTGTTTDIAQAGLTVTSPTSITLNPSTITGGTDTAIGVTGSQFGATEYVVVSYVANLNSGSSVSEQVTTTTDGSGNFTIYTLPVPAAIVAGTYTVTVTGSTTGRTASATLTVTTQPVLTVSPAIAAPGTSVTLNGSHFAKGVAAAITVQFAMTGATSTPGAATASVTPDATGNFSVQITVPAGAQPGAVSIVATQKLGTATLTASTSLTIGSLSPALAVSPSSSAAGTAVTVSGQGFLPGPNAPVVVTVAFAIPGATQAVTQTVDVDSTGKFTTSLPIPANALPGTAILTARQSASGVSATTPLTVTSAAATSTPKPTSTSTPTPTPTATSVREPATATPTPAKPHTAAVRFKSAYLLYAAVHLRGTNRVSAQANLSRRLTIQVAIVFPSGAHRDYRERTDASGRWVKTFSVPTNAMSRYSDRAYIMLQIWNGKSTAKTFLSFTVMR